MKAFFTREYLPHPSAFAPQSPFESNFWYYGSILFLYILTSPFYVFASGYPQPSDVFMFLLLLIPGVITLFLQSQRFLSITFMAGFSFILIAMAINLLNAAFFPDIKFLLHSLIYSFNFFVFTLLVAMVRSDPVRYTTIAHAALVCAIFMELLWVFAVPEPRFRASGSFNGTNQLAYWSLTSLVMLVLLRQGRKLQLIDYICIIILFYFQTLAISKASMVSALVVLCVLPFTAQFTRMGRILFLSVLIAAGSYALINPQLVLDLPQRFDNINNAVERLEEIGADRDDNLEGRGYTRIAENPEYVILGVGEGAYSRFTVTGKELHSGIATIIFSYGILGTLAFFGFIGAVLWRQRWTNIALVGCLMLYGLTHQNLRFTDFWICLAFVKTSGAMIYAHAQTQHAFKFPALLMRKQNHYAHAQS